jgi:hypothetical protein
VVGVGKIADLLLDRDGSVKSVVIGIGGFLGIGRKEVALPYSAIHWQTADRKIAVGTPPGGAGGTPGTTATPNESTQIKTIPATKEETYQGYPDKASLDMTEAQLKAAPDFKYAENPEAKVVQSSQPAGAAGGSMKP